MKSVISMEGAQGVIILSFEPAAIEALRRLGTCIDMITISVNWEAAWLFQVTAVPGLTATGMDHVSAAERARCKWIDPSVLPATEAQQHRHAERSALQLTALKFSPTQLRWEFVTRKGAHPVQGSMPARTLALLTGGV